MYMPRLVRGGQEERMPEGTNRTRQELDAALRDLLKRRPLDQIRVRELMELCGLRRQSFYYHFKDVFELFAWSVRQERERLLERQGECLTWRQALMDLMDRVDGNRAFYLAVLNQDGQAGLEGLIPLEETVRAAQRYYRDRSGVPPDPEGEERSCRCIVAVLLSLLESWIRGGLAQPPEELAAVLEKTAERMAEGEAWRTLWERGDWDERI